MKKLRLGGVKFTQLVDERFEMEDISITMLLRRADEILHVKDLAEGLTHNRCSNCAI